MLDLNPMTVLIIGAIGVMLYGERLPEVARAWGKQLMQLKKGIHSVQEQVQSTIVNATSVASESSASRTSRESETCEDHQEAIAPKFEPPPQQSAAALDAAKES